MDEVIQVAQELAGYETRSARCTRGLGLHEKIPYDENHAHRYDGTSYEPIAGCPAPACQHAGRDQQEPQDNYACLPEVCISIHDGGPDRFIQVVCAHLGGFDCRVALLALEGATSGQVHQYECD